MNPRVDLAFKKIFGVEENKPLLISLLNSIVSTEDQVRDAELLNPYNSQNFSEDKSSILDIKARGNNGRVFNIEMQVADETDYDSRILYYWSKLYSDQIGSGDTYSSLNKAIGIHILNFTSICTKKYHNKFYITEESGIRHFDKFELHTIELSKFSERIKDDDFDNLISKMKTKIDYWCAFLAKHDLLNKQKNKLPVECNDVKKALEVMNIMNYSKEERQAYEDKLQWLRIKASALDKRFNDGKQTGIKKGKKEGKKEAVKDVIMNMLSQGIGIDIISSVTNMPTNEILKLK